MNVLQDFAATDVASLSISGVVIGILALVMRSIVKGDLVPKATMDARLADKDAEITNLVASTSKRIDAQAEALTSASHLITESSGVIASQADSIRDFADASHLQVRVAEALHKNLPPGGET